MTSTSQCYNGEAAYGGTFQVTPASGGIGLTTKFQLSVSGWLDYNGEPLSYSVSYIKDPTLYSPNDPIMISDYTTNTQISFYLPSVASVKISVTIRDPFGCTTNSTPLDVTLASTQNQNSADLMGSAANFVQQALSSGNTQDFINAVNTVTDQISMSEKLLGCPQNPACSSTNCSGLSSCSGNGICSQDRCQCFSGFYLGDCSLNQSAYEEQLQARQELLEDLGQTMTSRNLTSEELASVLDLMDTLTQTPYLSDNKTLSTTVTALNQAIDNMISTATPDSVDSSNLQKMADILSNLFNQISEVDCGLHSNFSTHAYNTSYTTLQKLSELSLKTLSSDSSAESNLSTDSFVMYSEIVDSSNLNNLQINASAGSPAIQLGTIQNSQNMPSSVAVTYTYLKKDPLSCQAGPATNFSLLFKDATTWQPITVNTSIQVSYPKAIFTVILCSSGCQSSTDAEGNAICSCKDISVFDVANQLSRVFENSNFKLITMSNLALVFKSSLTKKWTFWVALVFAGWCLATLVAVSTVNKSKTLASDKYQHFRPRFLIYLAVAHPLLSIYLYKDPRIGKGYRALLYFVREMCILCVSSLFITKEVIIHYNYTISTDILVIRKLRW